MKRTKKLAQTHIVAGTMLLAILAVPIFAQSPAFPTVPPYHPPVFQDFPYHKYRVDERWGPVFPPPVIVFRSPQTRPSDYPYTQGYGSSPFIRVYGGAGSLARTPSP